MTRSAHPYVALAVGLSLASSSWQVNAQASRDLDIDFAYVTAFQATVYGYPLVGMYARLSDEVIDPATRKAPFNQFFHYRELATPTVSPFPAPNNDTLYSTAWLDLRDEPAILSVPDTAGRYYTAQILDLTTETLANVGRRVDGTSPGMFAIVGPGWNGALPAGITRVIRSETTIAYILLRILVDGPPDVPTVNALQDRFSIASLSRFHAHRTGTDDVQPLPAYTARDARERLDVLDRVLRLSPVPLQDKGMVASFAPIHVGPAATSLKIAASTTTLDRAEAAARALIASTGARTGVFVNGWRMPAKAIGSYGVDYLQRASVWDGGPLANIVEESFYPAALLDNAGRSLDGANAQYRIRFAPGRTPPVDAFWSLTMYKLDDKFLVANPINRYAIGNRTLGLAHGSDGSLTIAIQADRPKDAQDIANWLPAPKQPFYMVLRLYGPKESALSRAWTPPPVDRLGQ